MGASDSQALSSAPYTGRIGECAFRTGIRSLQDRAENRGFWRKLRAPPCLKRIIRFGGLRSCFRAISAVGMGGGNSAKHRAARNIAGITAQRVRKAGCFKLRVLCVLKKAFYIRGGRVIGSVFKIRSGIRYSTRVLVKPLLLKIFRRGSGRNYRF